MKKIPVAILNKLSALLLPTLPLAPAIHIPIELDDNSILHQIILITPYWEITRMYTDTLPSLIYEMKFAKLGVTFVHRSRIFITNE
jgi:hypothetical protein